MSAHPIFDKLVERWKRYETGVPYLRMATDAEEVAEEEHAALRSELAEARRLLEPFAQALDDHVDFDERPIGLRHIRAAADFLRRHPAK
jgi:hypothetical protein